MRNKKNIIEKILLVVVGGVIPAQDYQYLFDAGAVAVLT
jgi:methylmalonyl-CoA mutase cobalamin-binding subunit